MIVTLDGPAGAGKSSAARALAVIGPSVPAHRGSGTITQSGSATKKK